MARMLQALKNLEARSPAKPAPKPKAEPPMPAVERVVEPPIAPPAVRSMPPVTESLDALASQLANLEIAIQDPPVRFDWGGFPASSVAPPFPNVVPNVLERPSASVAAASRPACEIERLVRRTLSDLVRAKPLGALADRLRQDMQQTATKTLTFVGVGQSTTHEALLYAATLLAEQGSGKVLLVDADLSQRRLTEALEYEQERGLGELLADDSSAGDVCRPTAVGTVSFLPAGLCKQRDPSVVGPRWGPILKQLTPGFDCVLIDVGRTSDPAASTLARIADATYLVVQLGAVETSEAQTALADFRAAGARVLGCIAT